MREATREELEVLKAACFILKSMIKDELDVAKPINIHRLAMNCLEDVINDFGEKTIFITSDDEGNSYHTLYYTVDATPDKDELAYLKNENSCLKDYKDDEIALLG